MSILNNDAVILSGATKTVVGAGVGDDRYVLSAKNVTAGQLITISDAEADTTNILQLVGGLTISSSKVSNNAIELTLNNGAVVTVLGASKFSFQTGGDGVDGSGGTTQSFAAFVTLSLGVAAGLPAAGAAPVLSTTPVTVNPNGGTGTGVVTPTFALTSSATAVNEGASVTFDVVGGQPNLTYSYVLTGVDASDITGGALTGTINTDAAGKGTVTVVVANDRMTDGVDTLKITLPNTGLSASVTINDTSTNNVAPVATAATGATTEAGALVTGQLVATDAENDALSFAASPAVPGLTINANGTYSFDPSLNPAAQALTYQSAALPIVANYTVTDALGATATSTLTITVTPKPLTFTLVPAAAFVEEGQTLAYKLVASEAVATAFTASVQVVPGDGTTGKTGANDFGSGALNPQNVSIAIGQTESTLFNVIPQNDAVTEVPESYTVKTTVAGYTVADVEGSVRDPSTVGGVGQTFTLTTSPDTLPGLIGSAGSTGTDGNDTINATTAFLPGTATKVNTLSALDNLNGGLGSNKLVISDTDTTANFTLATGITLSNIQAITIAAAGSATADITPSTITGVTSLAVTQATAATLTAAATTDITVSGVTGLTATTGGKTVSVTQDTNAIVGTVDAAIDTVASITVTNAKDVTIVANKSLSNANAAGGATDVDAGISVVNATGAVNVTATGGKVVGGTANYALDAVTVTGGTTVNVTQAATADMGDIATKAVAGGTKDIVTQGAVTVTGGAATTSVSVVQADQAVAKAAVAAVAGVSATQVVTFKSMASGASITIDGLTFTSSKALTAAEAAAAFAGLTAVENQGQGFSTNGFYTGVTSTNWNTSAVTGATVTYSQKVAGTGTLAVPTATGNDNAAIPAALVIAAVAGATAITAVTGVTGVLGVANGAVAINDNAGTTKSITTLVVDGYSAGATLGNTNNLNALTNLTLANSGTGTATVVTNAATLGLTVNDVTAGVTITNGSLKTLNVTTATKDSKFILATVTGVEALNVAGTNAIDLQTTALTGLKTVTVGGSAGLTVDASGANMTSFTTTTTGTVNATIDSTKGTYTGGAGVDNVTFSNTTAAAKAVMLGAGDDKVTLATGTTATPTVTIDGGAGTDTLAMASADAATVSTGSTFASKFTSFEKLSLGAVVTGATDSVNLANMNNINYVVSAGSGSAAAPTAPVGTPTNGAVGTKESTSFAISSLAAGESYTINGLTVTSSGVNAAATVAAVFQSGVSAGTLTVTGAYTTPAAWSGIPVVSGGATTLILTNTVNGDVADFTASTSTGAVGTGVLTLTKMANAGTLELTGASAGTVVTMTDATGLADSFNIVTKVGTADLSFASVDVAGVETINITATDTAPTNLLTAAATINTSTLTLKDAALKTVVVTGNSNLTLGLDANVIALTSVDASAMTGKLTATTNGTVAQTITAGAGADSLSAKAGAVTADVLLGGAGNDTLTSNKGLNVLTGGAGVDTFVVGEASLNVNSYATITDASAGDIIKFAGTVGTFAASKVTLGGTAVFQDFANAITAGTVANAMSWFQFGGDTYIVKDMNISVASFNNGTDMIVKLTGLVDLSVASYSATLGTIEIGA